MAANEQQEEFRQTTPFIGRKGYERLQSVHDAIFAASKATTDGRHDHHDINMMLIELQEASLNGLLLWQAMFDEGFRARDTADSSTPKVIEAMLNTFVVGTLNQRELELKAVLRKMGDNFDKSLPVYKAVMTASLAVNASLRELTEGKHVDREKGEVQYASR